MTLLVGVTMATLIATSCSAHDARQAHRAPAAGPAAASSSITATRASEPVTSIASAGPTRSAAHTAAPVGQRSAARTVAASTVRPSPCADNSARQLVVVRVRQQHAWMCERHVAVFDSPVTTGAVDLPYDSTPTGTFYVQDKQRHRVLTLLSGAQYTVQYWIPFEAPLFGFHDSSWQNFPYGSARYRTEGSHGCVHLPLKTIAFLYDWADIGATVRIGS